VRRQFFPFRFSGILPAKTHDAAVIAVMKGVRLLDGIRRQYSYSVDTAIFELFIRCHKFPN
jgi:hypothetical protein